MLYFVGLVFLLLFLIVLLAVTQIVLLFAYAGQNAKEIRKERLRNKTPIAVGFFHPNCLGGGGGERVLWTAVNAMQTKWPELNIVIYCNQNSFPNWNDKKLQEQAVYLKDLIEKQFRIAVNIEHLTLVPLSLYKWMTSEQWTRFTLFGQSLGALAPAFEALTKKLPEIYIDTVGAALTYPIAKHFFGCKVVSYTHYPVISTDMLDRVASRKVLYNNNSRIASSKLLSSLKLVYYKIFAKLYGWCGGKNSDVTMVNSTWTLNHVKRIWNTDKVHTVYPPCDVSKLTINSLDESSRTPFLVVSVAQFRPEKNHELQLQIAAEWNKRHGVKHPLQLVLIGGCRKHSKDEERVQLLEQMAISLKIEEHVTFKINSPYEELLQYLSKASVGLHTMVDEHFGIGIIEYMAAGAIAVAHNSGGPRSDIISESGRDGFLATTCNEYVEALETVFLKFSTSEKSKLKQLARKRVLEKFSDEKFRTVWIDLIKDVITC